MEGMPIEEEGREDDTGRCSRIQIDLPSSLRNNATIISGDDPFNSIDHQEDRTLEGSPSNTERIFSKMNSLKLEEERRASPTKLEEESRASPNKLEEEKLKVKGLSEKIKRLRAEGLSSSTTNWFQDSRRLLQNNDTCSLSPKGFDVSLIKRAVKTSTSFYAPLPPPFATDVMNASVDCTLPLTTQSPETLLRARDQRSKALVGLLIAEENRRILARRVSVGSWSSHLANSQGSIETDDRTTICN